MKGDIWMSLTPFGPGIYLLMELDDNSTPNQPEGIKITDFIDHDFSLHSYDHFRMCFPGYNPYEVEDSLSLLRLRGFSYSGGYVIVTPDGRFIGGNK